MDPLAHALAGTLLGKTNPSRKRGLVLACLAGALIPDIDIVLTLWSRNLYITEHRGFTHSLLGLLPMSLLAAWMAAWVARNWKDRASFTHLWFMALVGVVSHLLLDWCTAWGTMLLWPNRTRFALDNLFIIDAWYWAVLALPLGAAFFFKEQSLRLCWAGFLLVLGYHGLAGYNHWKALQIVRHDRPGAVSLAFPQPFSPFRWSAYNRAEGLVRNAYINFLEQAGPTEWNEWKEPPKSAALQLVLDSPEGKQYLWFARMPMWEELKQVDGSTVIYFWDLRFNAYWHADQTTRRFGEKFVVRDGKVTAVPF